MFGFYIPSNENLRCVLNVNYLFIYCIPYITLIKCMYIEKGKSSYIKEIETKSIHNTQYII